MIKKILKLDKEQVTIFNASVRPFVIYCIFVAIVVIVGSLNKSMSSEMADGYICSMILCMLCNYMNLRYMEFEKMKDNTK